MKKLALKAAFLVFALGGLVALPLAFASGDKSEVRRDCPGKVVCPLTGEEVCKDRCPLGASRATAATAATTETADELPPCCRNLKK